VQAERELTALASCRLVSKLPKALSYLTAALSPVTIMVARERAAFFEGGEECWFSDNRDWLNKNLWHGQHGFEEVAIDVSLNMYAA
jgi:hypothetical protein